MPPPNNVLLLCELLELGLAIILKRFANQKYNNSQAKNINNKNKYSVIKKNFLWFLSYRQLP